MNKGAKKVKKPAPEPITQSQQKVNPKDSQQLNTSQQQPKTPERQQSKSPQQQQQTKSPQQQQQNKSPQQQQQNKSPQQQTTNTQGKQTKNQQQEAKNPQPSQQQFQPEQQQLDLQASQQEGLQPEQEENNQSTQNQIIEDKYTPPKDNNENSTEMLNQEAAKRRRADLDRLEVKKVQASSFEKYICETGINTAFQLIFSEIITKKVPVENYYSYTASRLRQFGRELEEIKAKGKK